VKNHLERIYGALGASNRTEAAMRMRDLGIDEGD
jgi:DNA-binding NarL/FixJ family response regulator